MGNADFRVRGKIFATLHLPKENRGALKLTLEQQKAFMAAEPAAFEPAAGAWGRKGWTTIHLRQVKVATARRALDLAWNNVAPKRLVDLSKSV